MKHIISIFLVLVSCFSINAEVRIHMEKEGGVYKVPCEVIGLKLKFIFDTGAASVCISETYADMMLDNGYLEESDIKGVSQSTIADGSNIDNVVINLRKVEIGGLSLENVSAVVVPTQKAPLLLGQSVIQRLGKVSIDGEYLVIHNAASQYSEEELDMFYDRAEKLFEEEQYVQALETYKKIYEAYGNDTGTWILLNMGVCYSNLDDDSSAEVCFLKALELADGEEDEADYKYTACYNLGLVYFTQQEYDKSIKYRLLASEYAGKDLMLKAECYRDIAYCYHVILNNNSNFTKAYEYYDKAEKAYISIVNIDKSILANMYSEIAFCYLGDYTGIPDQHYYKAIEYYDKAINSYNSVLKKSGKLDEKQICDYINSYGFKATSLQMLKKYEDAIEVRNVEKDLLKKYDSQISDRQWYDVAIKAANSSLSECYKKLNE